MPHSSLGYPLAYVMAFRSGRLKNFLLGLVILPFFTTFLVRTFAWKTILNDGGPVVVGRSGACTCCPGGPAAQYRSWAVIGGLTYNFLPFMILPIYVSLEKIDRRLVEAAQDLYCSPLTRLPESGVAAVAPRGVRRQPADVHSGLR